MGGITLEEFSRNVAYKEIFGQGLREGRQEGRQEGHPGGRLQGPWQASLSWPCASRGVVAACSPPLR
jgi:hypothetical protein